MGGPGTEARELVVAFVFFFCKKETKKGKKGKKGKERKERKERKKGRKEERKKGKKERKEGMMKNNILYRQNKLIQAQNLQSTKYSTPCL